MPEIIANGVAINQANGESSIVSNLGQLLRGEIVQCLKHFDEKANPAIANEPTTNSVAIT